jgi:hypothetical protein
MSVGASPSDASSRGSGNAAFRVTGGDNNVLTNCKAEGHETGFLFEGGGRHTLIDAKSYGNQTGIKVRQSEVEIQNADIR